MLFEKLKSAFWEDDAPKATNPKSLQQGVPAQSIATNPVITPNFTTAPPAPMVNNTTGVISEEFSNHFDIVLDASNVPGIGYAQFNKALAVFDSMKGTISEPQRFEMALKSMQAQGMAVTKDLILSTANKFIDLLAADNANADKLVDQRKNEEIVSRQQEIEKLNAEILDKQNQIEALNNAIQANKTDIATKQNEISQQASLIDQRQQNYKATWAVYNNHILQDIQNITSYLPNDVAALASATATK